jgi:hypothetical protein
MNLGLIKSASIFQVNYWSNLDQIGYEHCALGRYSKPVLLKSFCYIYSHHSPKCIAILRQKCIKESQQRSIFMA